MFWKIFVSLCEETGEKPTPLTKKLGLAHASVTRWKNGSNPNKKSLSVIAEYFGVSTDYLLGKTDVKNGPTANSETEEGYFLIANRANKDGQAIEKLSKAEYDAAIAWIRTLRKSTDENL